MNYGSVCSGIEAATVAWHPLGWRPAWFSEIDRFPSAVLAHHYPNVPNRGDMTKFKEWPDERIDVLVGGTPCQSFSVAGLRKGLDDPRGNLALVFLAILDRLRPEWVVWENVPGVRSTGEGRGLAAFLGGLSQLGYGWAYRSLDAQYFGLAQRRERVFVVGHLGDWRRAGAVLLERESLSGNPPPSREAGKRVAPSLETRAGRSGGNNFNTSGGLIENTPPLSNCLNGKGGAGRMDAESETLIPTGGGFDVAHALKAEGFDAGEDGTGRGVPLIAETLRHHPRAGSNSLGAIAFSPKDYGADAGELAPTLRAMGHDGSHPNAGGQIAVAMQEGQTGCREYDTAGSLRANGPGHDPVGTRVRLGSRVRRLTPRECERLQGFPDDYTLVPYRKKPAADGPRYKAIGNSMPVPVMRWIGQRIVKVQS